MTYIEATDEHITNIVHLDTQQNAPGIDLTVAAVYDLKGSGALDFGGSEFEEADREEIEPEKQDPDDDYGWWNLKPGTYLIAFNEGVTPPDGAIATIHPHQRLIEAGGTHASSAIVQEQEQMHAMLVVGTAGLRIKENARTSTLFLTE